MEKFASQQAALRQAFVEVGLVNPVKGQLQITAEQRVKVSELMMKWLKEERWSIKPGTRASIDPRNYIAGTAPTCLIQAWTMPRVNPAAAATTAAEAKPNPLASIKTALEMGLITKEQAQEAALKLLGI